jgi:hypothetical protein
MKYVSFSLWGSNPLYNVGAIRNAQLMKDVYPDWKMVVYYNNTVPIETVNKLNELNVLTKDMTKSYIFPCFWRFTISDNKDCEYAIFRDCDSRISLREKLAVDEWINSGKSIHVMRDHPAHGIPYGYNGLGILAGMWGIKGRLYNMTGSILEFTLNKQDNYGIDQTYLGEVFKKYIDDRFTHDEYYEKNPFPIKRANNRFIGERIDVSENPLTDDYKNL